MVAGLLEGGSRFTGSGKPLACFPPCASHFPPTQCQGLIQ